eukprot:8012-Heterococcus_DN1.PRE.1
MSTRRPSSRPLYSSCKSWQRLVKALQYRSYRAPPGEYRALPQQPRAVCIHNDHQLEPYNHSCVKCFDIASISVA